MTAGEWVNHRTEWVANPGASLVRGVLVAHGFTIGTLAAGMCSWEVQTLAALEPEVDEYAGPLLSGFTQGNEKTDVRVENLANASEL